MLLLVKVCRPAKAFNFYPGHPDVCSAIIIINHLHHHHLISGINAWDVGVVRYSAGIVDRTVEELVSMNRKILVL